MPNPTHPVHRWRPHSLRTVLPIAVGGVALVAIVVTATVAGWLARHAQQHQAHRYERTLQVLDRHVAALPKHATDADAHHAAAGMAAELDQRVVLTRLSGQVWADSTNNVLIPEQPRFRAVPDSTSNRSGRVLWVPGGGTAEIGMPIGNGLREESERLHLTAVPSDLSISLPPDTILIFADGLRTPLEPPLGILSGLNNTLMLAAAAAAAAATILAALVSRYILQPIIVLTTAARRLRDGDRQHRVPVAGRDEIANLAHAFNALAEQLERTERLREQMTADIAHELRTPLTNLSGWLDGARDGITALDEQLLAILQDETQRLTCLVDDLAELARAEAEGFHLEYQPTDLATVIHQCVTLAQSKARARGVTLTTRTTPQVLIEADPARLTQILANLLDNAITHTPPDGTVRIDTTTDDHNVMIYVRDDGPGIAAEHLTTIFERFWRADPARTRQAGGSGLGLAIARQLARAHGGDITASNQPSAGAGLTVVLPTDTHRHPAAPC